MAQAVEHILGKDEVTGSNPVISSKKDGFSTVFFFCHIASNAHKIVLLLK